MLQKFLSVSEYDLLPQVRDFLSKEFKNCINGTWQSAVNGETFEKKDPHSGAKRHNRFLFT